MNQWDATSLITCAKKFKVKGCLVLAYALDAAKIVITNEVKAERAPEASAVLDELIKVEYDQVLLKLHQRYQRGEITFRAVAKELGLSVRELYNLFEQKGLPI